MRLGERRLARPRRAPAPPDRRSTRQTEVFERVAGSRGEEVDPRRARRPSRRCTREVGVGARDQRVEAADRFRPVERVEIVLDAEHRRRVDRLAREDAFDQLAALGHAEDLRQRPGRLVGLEPLDGARRKDQHAVLRLAAQHLLPGEGDDIELVERRAAARRRREVASQIVSPSRSAGIQSPSGTRTPDVVPFQVKTTSRSKSTFARSGSSP